MDDPMVRSRLGRANGTRPLGPLIPSKGPSFFAQINSRLIAHSRYACLRLTSQLKREGKAADAVLVPRHRVRKVSSTCTERGFVLVSPLYLGYGKLSSSTRLFKSNVHSSVKPTAWLPPVPQ